MNFCSRKCSKSTHGSALLTVILLMTALSFFCMIVWRATSYGVDLVVQKICYEQERQALYGLQDYAAYFVMKNYDQLKELSADCQIIFDHWPLKTSRYQAVLRIVPDAISFKIECCIQKNNMPLKTSIGLYAKDSNEQRVPVVIAWQTV